jgi:hypothetical protein
MSFMSRKNSLTRRISRAFSADDLARICAMPEDEFASAFDMQRVEVEQRKPQDFYLFRDNGAHVLAVAHLDTVAKPDTRAANFVTTQAGRIVYSRALDDRLGAYIILRLLPELGITYDWLLTTGEEYGMSTAEFFTTEKDYDWVIEFDRGGTDVVMYQYEDYETRLAVKSAGATVGNGIFSDIGALEHLNVKCFNWGTGYRDYHSARSHAYLSDTFMMVAQYMRFHALYAGIAMPHEPYYPPSRRTADKTPGYDCTTCDAVEAVDPETLICRYCHTYDGEASGWTANYQTYPLPEISAAIAPTTEN